MASWPARSVENPSDSFHTPAIMPPAPVSSSAATLTIGARLVGREPLLRRLDGILAEVEQGQSRIVTLLGAPGIGKSRLINEFVETRLLSGPRRLMVYRPLTETVRSQSAIQRLLSARFGLRQGLAVEQARGLIMNEVARVLGDRDVADVCYFLGQLVELPFRATPLTRAVADDPKELLLVRHAILRRFVEADAERQPVCLIVQQLDAVDEDSLELFEYLAQSVRGRVLVLATARPELLGHRRSWLELGGERHVRLDVDRLGPEAATELAEALLARCQPALREPLVEAAVSLARGNPGLMERVVRTYHDLGVIESRDEARGQKSWKVNVERLASVQLPMTAEDTVAARIGALSVAERRLLEHAAAVGNVFWLGAVVVLARIERACPEVWDPSQMEDVSMIRGMLEDLERRDYVLSLPESALFDDREYVFKHTMERDKLLSLTPSSTLRRIHLCVADWFLTKPNVLTQEETSAMLAQHLERGGSRSRAGQYFLTAGDLAREHQAARRASENYTRGLDLLGESDASRRLDALHNYGDVLLMLGKPDEALSAFRAMLELGFRLNRANKGGAAHNRIGRLYRERGSLEAAQRHLEAGLQLFEAAGDERGIAASRDDIGRLLWIRGDYPKALEHLSRALSMRKVAGDRRSIALSLNNLGLVWMDQGSVKQARQAFEASLSLRREVSDTLGTAESLSNLGCLAQDQNDWERALLLFDEAYQLLRGIGEPNQVARLLTQIGATQYHLGRASDAIEVLTEAEGLCDDLGDRLNLAEALRGLAKAYLHQRKLDRARESIKRSVDLFGQVRAKPHLAIALRTLAEVTAAGAWGEGHEQRVVDYFMRSIALCKEIGNELEVARSYRAFAEFVLGEQGYRHNQEIVKEARTLGQMATEIFERQRVTLSSTPLALDDWLGAEPRSRPGPIG